MAYDLPKAPKVFLDASVLIAAAISSTGSAKELITLGLHGECELIVSDLVLEETERNLLRKAPTALPAFRLFREALAGEVVSPPRSLVVKVSNIIELKDAPIVAGAIQAKADYLVTYDRKHLLRQRKKIRNEFRVAVVTPDTVVKRS